MTQNLPLGLPRDALPQLGAWPFALYAVRGAAYVAARQGDAQKLEPRAGLRRAQAEAMILLHRPATAALLGRAGRFVAYDLLELYAFVRPAQFVLPTVKGLAQAMDIAPSLSPIDTPEFLHRAAQKMLQEIESWTEPQARAAESAAWGLWESGWPWGAWVLDRLQKRLGPYEDRRISLARGIDIWRRLPEWNDEAPSGPPGHESVPPDAAELRLSDLRGPGAEDRPQQRAFARQAAAAFAPREAEENPHLVLAEAGTGTGKTLGYVAPASLWAERNGAPVWISTYTRNLQRQIDEELARLHPDPAVRARKVVVRKGRENYLCLLNMEEAWMGGAAQPADRIALGLLARWAGATRDGDLTGGDFPAWLADLVGAGRTLSLADRRGECIHNACPHYRVCFIERAIRKAKTADLVIANHALVMHQAAANPDRQAAPLRYVFDEGHHLFDAADSAFGAELSASEAHELRRWIRGSEGGRRGRGRGLEKRIGDLAASSDEMAQAMIAIIESARLLPREGWAERLLQSAPPGSSAAPLAGEPSGPIGPIEAFLAKVRAQVRARTPDHDRHHDWECAPHPVTEAVALAALHAAEAIDELAKAMERFAQGLGRLLNQKADIWDSAERNRALAAQAGIERRLEAVKSWRGMLQNLIHDEKPAEYVDGFSLLRIEGQERDILYFRRYRDPTKPFAEAVLKSAFGAVICSATLRDVHEEDGDGWSFAEARTGVDHLLLPPQRVSLSSPFDYASQTQVLIVTDVKRGDIDQIASAYRSLMQASGGGGLGLFTAVARLRAVHQRIAPALESAGIPVYAQHVDAIGNAALVEMFRQEEDSCLLGTDAMRDGVDVPGRSLRLLVFDRMPWPRPDLLHRARREAFGGRAYDDALTRLRLKQAFGRLIRRADDRGIFVLLDAASPSRLLSAFPAGVEPQRMGLAQAVAQVKSFLFS